MGKTLFAKDISYVEAMSVNMEAYLLSKGIYWKLPHTVAVSGTLGGVLLRMRRASHWANSLMTTYDVERVDALNQTIFDSLGKYPAQAEEKARRETKARIEQWTAYVEDCEYSADACKPSLGVQVENRTVVKLLVDFAGEPKASLRQMLKTADSNFYGMTTESDFAWHPAIIAGFPAKQFPWLYADLVVYDPRITPPITSRYIVR